MATYDLIASSDWLPKRQKPLGRVANQEIARNGLFFYGPIVSRYSIGS